MGAAPTEAMNSDFEELLSIFNENPQEGRSRKGSCVRDTKYARELREPGVKKWPTGSEGRIERLLIKKSGTQEIRFSWWKDGRLATRPLDLSEEDLLALFEDAIAEDVFTTEFRARLKSLL